MMLSKPIYVFIRVILFLFIGEGLLQTSWSKTTANQGANKAAVARKATETTANKKATTDKTVTADQGNPIKTEDKAIATAEENKTTAAVEPVKAPPAMVSDNTGREIPMTIEQNMGKVIPLSESVGEVFVANPDIADIQLNGTSAAYVFGKKPGNTTIFATDHDGKVVLKLYLHITHNLKQLNQTAKTSFPEENVKFDSTPSGIIINGKPSSPVVAKNIENLASGFIDQGQKITNNMTVSSPTQVMLKVKIAEISRSVLHKFDINWSALINSPNHFSYGLLMGREPMSSGQFQRSTSVPQMNSYGVSFNDGVSSYAALLDALDQEGLGTILAEPNLVAISGETASFLVGGEFPYPVPQDQNITIEFKQFGISLSFTPTVLNSNMINLRVRPEVSELDNQNSISVPVGSGSSVVSVPGLKTRRAETSVELGDGQSLAIAGLISSKIANSYSSLPGLDSIPILGALFRSTKFQRDQTELVIIVTPYVIKPASRTKDLSVPTEVKSATAVETLFTGRLNRVEKTTAVNCKGNCFYGAAGFNVNE